MRNFALPTFKGQMAKIASRIDGGLSVRLESVYDTVLQSLNNE
jgi:hypothetical protein